MCMEACQGHKQYATCQFCLTVGRAGLGWFRQRPFWCSCCIMLGVRAPAVCEKRRQAGAGCGVQQVTGTQVLPTPAAMELGRVLTLQGVETHTGTQRRYTLGPMWCGRWCADECDLCGVLCLKGMGGWAWELCSSTVFSGGQLQRDIGSHLACRLIGRPMYAGSGTCHAVMV